MIRNLLPRGESLDNAYLLGLITDEEYLLLDIINANYSTYEHHLKKALEKGILTDEDEKNLRDIRKRIYANALRAALKDKEPTNEEKIIIEKLKSCLGLDRETFLKIEKDLKEEEGIAPPDSKAVQFEFFNE
jgi:DNA-binding transcriptional ArsR family regulator